MSFWSCFRTRTCGRRNVDRRWLSRQTIAATIASNMARAGHASRVVVRVDSESAKGSGLLMDSVIMSGNLATIQYSEIDRILGAFSAPEGTRRSLANHPGIIVETSQTQFLATTVIGVHRSDPTRCRNVFRVAPTRNLNELSGGLRLQK